MSNRVEISYLNEGQGGKGINFATFIQSVPARLGEQTVSRWEFYPNTAVHPLEDTDPLTDETVRDYLVTTLAQNLYSSATHALRAHQDNDEQRRANNESEAANNLLFHRDHQDVISKAQELAQRANDEEWPFIAAKTSYPIIIKYQDLPQDFDQSQPIELETAVPYISVLNHQKGSPDRILDPMDRNWAVRIDYLKLFQHMKGVLQPESETTLGPERIEDLVNAIFANAGLAAAPGFGEGPLKELWVYSAAITLLPYRNNKELLEKLTDAAHEQDQEIDHSDFIQRVLQLVQRKDISQLSKEEINRLKVSMRTLAWNMPGQYINPEGINKAEAFLGVKMAPYIHDQEFIQRLAQKITDGEPYYME